MSNYVAPTTTGETPDLPAKTLMTGTWLWIGADAFFFMSIFFAFVYLRALNSNLMWNPKGQNPSLALGSITLTLVVVSAVLVEIAATRLRRARAWSALAGGALALLVAAILLQGWQLFKPGFSPGHAGAYGSVFIAFTAAYLLHLLGAGYVLETLLVGGRARRYPLEPGGADLTSSYEAFALYFYFLAAVFIIFYGLFYLVH
jgi:heme/copper-type cytochrome/quinol oxidase subunit 3